MAPKDATAAVAPTAEPGKTQADADAPSSTGAPAPVVPAPPADASAKAQQFTLANGMTLIVQPDKRSPTAVNMVWVRVGSYDEVDGTSGVAHVLEHMMFKGTPTVPAGQFSRRVAALGGRENAFTSRDNTGYYQQIPAGKLPDVMRLEADRFAHNMWPNDEFKREIEVVKEERRLRTEDQPRALLGEQQNAAVFTASPYHRPIVGWMSDLDAMTPDDARAFYKRWYVPANAAVVIAGDVDVQEVHRLADETYGRIPAGEVPARKPRTEPAQRGIRRIDFKAPAEQSYVSLAFRTPQFDAATVGGHCAAPAGAGCESAAMDADSGDALSLLVLAAVLDGYPGSRLDRALRQGPDRVADSVGAYYGFMGRGPQLFGLDGVPAEGKTPAQLEQALRAQVERIANDGITEAELARVKVQWVASETYKLDSVMAQARELGSNWVQGLPLDATPKLIEKLLAVDAEQVKAVAGKYFGDDQLTVAVLRPQPVDKAKPPRVSNVPAGDLR